MATLCWWRKLGLDLRLSSLFHCRLKTNTLQLNHFEQGWLIQYHLAACSTVVLGPQRTPTKNRNLRRRLTGNPQSILKAGAKFSFTIFQKCKIILFCTFPWKWERWSVSPRWTLISPWFKLHFSGLWCYTYWMLIARLCESFLYFRDLFLLSLIHSLIQNKALTN